MPHGRADVTKGIRGIHCVVTVSFPRQRVALKRHGFDAAYLQRLRDGDPETERHFCAYFGELILIKVRARPGWYALADDVRQETFLRVLRTLRSNFPSVPGKQRTFGVDDAENLRALGYLD